MKIQGQSLLLLMSLTDVKEQHECTKVWCLVSPGKRQTGPSPPQLTPLYLLQVHGDCFTIFNQPGALLHLHFIEELSIENRRMAFQANSEAPSLDIHHHILPLQPEVHLERDGQLEQTKGRCEEQSN